MMFLKWYRSTESDSQADIGPFKDNDQRRREQGEKLKKRLDEMRSKSPSRSRSGSHKSRSGSGKKSKPGSSPYPCMLDVLIKIIILY